VEQFPPLQSRRREYRLGLETGQGGRPQWQRLWHFDEVCKAYPTRNFRIRTDKPSDDELCSGCNRASGS